jgi:hypothetical protein
MNEIYFSQSGIPLALHCCNSLGFLRLTTVSLTILFSRECCARCRTLIFGIWINGACIPLNTLVLSDYSYALLSVALENDKNFRLSISAIFPLLPIFPLTGYA